MINRITHPTEPIADFNTWMMHIVNERKATAERIMAIEQKEIADRQRMFVAGFGGKK
jgi:hypothetical protein